MVPAPAVDTLMTALLRASGSVDLVWENAIFRGSGPPSRRMTKPESDMAKQTGPASGRRKTARNAERRKRAKKDTRAVLGLPVLHADTAGIDIGATEIYVAVPAGRDEEPVRCFGGFTGDLRDIAAWLGQCGVPGKKTDVEDCQWLQFLHSVGLLRGSYRPEQAICGVRTLLRYRLELIRFAAEHIQHMQKALEQMNVKLSHVISELTGVSGLAIVDAILSGERDPRKLAQLRDPRVQASEETIMKSLEGDYRPEHLFTLQHSLDLFRHYQKKIGELDQKMETFMSELPDRIDVGKFPIPPRRKKSRPHKHRNAPAFDLRTHCYRILGVDLTAIDGIDEITAHTVVTEVGPDLSAFPSASQFSGWLRLCPNHGISGGKILSRQTRKGKNRLALALRTAAATLYHSQSPLGEYYRRMKAKLGPAPAITAAAHKLARIIYHMITTGQAFDPEIVAKQDEKQQLKREARFRRQARDLGYELVKIQAVQA
jgi:transposase